MDKCKIGNNQLESSTTETELGILRGYKLSKSYQSDAAGQMTDIILEWINKLVEYKM